MVFEKTTLRIWPLYDKISKAVDEGEYAVGVFVDLSKALIP